MSNKKILEIEGLEAAELLNRFESLTKEIHSLKEELTTSKTKTEYLTRLNVAAMFGITLPTVHEWHKKGILKGYKIANRIFFKRAEVEAALTQVSHRHRPS